MKGFVLGAERVCERILVASPATVTPFSFRRTSAFPSHRKAVRARIRRGFLRGIEECVGSFAPSSECRLAEIGRERREVMLGQRIELRGLERTC